jgi:hypothetical protein
MESGAIYRRTWRWRWPGTFFRTRSARERPKEEIARDILVFFLAVEREGEGKGNGEVDKPFPRALLLILKSLEG